MNLASIILRFLLRISFIFPLLCCGQQTFTFDHNGIIREYILYLPNDLNENAPLIFVLHGFASSAQTIMTYSGMNGLADANGFAVCYPQGTEDIGGTTHWNANLNISNTDDKAFLSELVHQALNPDPHKLVLFLLLGVGKILIMLRHNSGFPALIRRKITLSMEFIT